MFNLILVFGVLINSNHIERFISMPDGCLVELKGDEVLKEIEKKMEKNKSMV